MEKPEVLHPDKDALELVKMILQQHDQIIQINSDLMKVLSKPVMYMAPSRIER